MADTRRRFLAKVVGIAAGGATILRLRRTDINPRLIENDDALW